MVAKDSKRVPLNLERSLPRILKRVKDSLRKLLSKVFFLNEQNQPIFLWAGFFIFAVDETGSDYCS